ncbi:MAG: superoxide dismutase [Bdellovibrionales bacterium RIFOXYD1_FULL_44_7]|nr:MAG: superoxide dismutase [Bdellovibrionales bacterium RIFOXYD1_FULL_44_7]
MTHKLPDLSFSKDALSPVISAETIDYHYDKHHRNYVDKLNRLIKGTEFENLSLHDIALRSNGPIYNNAAQAWNHEFYWNCLKPGAKQKPGARLLDAISHKFGSFEDFQKQFHAVALNHFASGWAWLVVQRNGALAIRTTGNADRPYINDEVPIYTADLWEHAYYIDYRNDRAKYLSGLWQLVNWEFVELNYLQVKQAAA